MITFNRAKGTLTFSSGLVLAGIWSGHGDAANDPSREREKGIGPLPAGDYEIGAPRDGGHLGPFVMDLKQISGDSYGRDLFRIHGDTVDDENHEASDGCIIAPRSVRTRIDREVERIIRVV